MWFIPNNLTNNVWNVQLTKYDCVCSLYDGAEMEILGIVKKEINAISQTIKGSRFQNFSLTSKIANFRKPILHLLHCL